MAQAFPFISCSCLTDVESSSPCFDCSQHASVHLRLRKAQGPSCAVQRVHRAQAAAKTAAAADAAALEKFRDIIDARGLTNRGPMNMQECYDARVGPIKTKAEAATSAVQAGVVTIFQRIFVLTDVALTSPCISCSCLTDVESTSPCFVCSPHASVPSSIAQTSGQQALERRCEKAELVGNQ